MTTRGRILEELRLLYGDNAAAVASTLMARVDAFRRDHPAALPPVELTERDALLNVCGDTICSPDEAPLHTLERFRCLASQAIMLAPAGLPGIYLHSLLGAHNCLPCAEATGCARSNNRESLNLMDIEHDLVDPNQRMRLVFEGYRRMLRVRRPATGATLCRGALLQTLQARQRCSWSHSRRSGCRRSEASLACAPPHAANLSAPSLASIMALLNASNHGACFAARACKSTPCGVCHGRCC